MNNLRAMWDDASPTMKRVVMGGVALSVFVVFGTFITMMDRGQSRPKPVKSEVEASIMMPSRKNTDMESLATSATAMQRRIQQLESERKMDLAALQEQLKQLREQSTQGDGSGRELTEIKARLDAFNSKIEELQAQEKKPLPPMSPTRMPPVSGKMPPLAAVIPRDGGEPVPPVETAPSVPLKPAEPEMVLRTIGAEEPKKSDGKGDASPSAGDAKTPVKTASEDKGSKAGGVSSRDKEDQGKPADSEYLYIPMGSMVQGVLLNGLDAPTSGAAQKNPTPVLIRLKHDAILPNHARMDIKECFMVASGHGSMSTERAMLRSEGISCVREDGGVVETNIAGYAIGEDGKVGMRGRLVSKQGAMIARSLASGFLSGLGRALTPTGVTGLNLAPTTTMQTQSYDMGTAFEAGMLGGASNSLNQIAKFYLDIAKEMVPVVEIDAGRPITVVLTRGANLRLQRK